jgi:hypothetical protein
MRDEITEEHDVCGQVSVLTVFSFSIFKLV